MKHYHIEKIGEQTVVLATSYVNPLAHLHEIEQKLTQHHVTGSILFDLFASNGFAMNRFLRIPFDGAAFDRQTVTIDQNVDGAIQHALHDVYQANKEWLDQSAIIPSQKAAMLAPWV